MANSASRAENRVWIPEISDSELSSRAERIRPVVIQTGRLHYLPKCANLRKVQLLKLFEKYERATGLKWVKTMTTFHTLSASFYEIIKPPIAECLAQIPDNLLGKVVAFQVTGVPDQLVTKPEEKAAIQAGFHVGTTRLYIKK